MKREDWRYLWRIRDKRDRKKVNIRWMDRWYFRKMLPKAMYDNYEIHHDWENGAVCYLFTPWMHRGALTKGNKGGGQNAHRKNEQRKKSKST